MVTILPSTAPEKDVQVLWEILYSSSDRSAVVEAPTADDNGILILNDHERNRWSIILIPTSDESPKKKNAVVCLTLEPEDYTNVSFRWKNFIQQHYNNNDVEAVSDNHDKVDRNDTIIQLLLPGGSWILFVSTSDWKNPELRIRLARQAQSIWNGTSNEHQMTIDNVLEDKNVRNNNELPQFPTLQVQVRKHPYDDNDNNDTNFPLNSKVPIPVETDLFVGQMIIIIRPPNPEQEDPYWNERIFSKRKRRMIIQIQGKFKRKPKGVVYAGGEVSDPMKLGLLSRGLCSVLLNLIDRLNTNMHYSFGDDDRQEEAHIVVPAYTFFERLIVTPPGMTPPILGEDELNESIESLTRRRKSKETGDWNTTDTYTMSFYSMYVDLSRWKIVNVPVTRDIDLRTFWGNSFLRIVLYEMNTPPGDSRHLREYNQYALVIQVQFKGDRPVIITNNASGDEDSTQPSEEVMPWNISKPLVNRQPSRRVLEDRSESSVSLNDYEDRSEEFFFFDAEEEHIEECTDPSNLVTSPLSLLIRIDQLCPAVIDVWTGGPKGCYMPVYAFNVQNGSRTVLRSYSLCTDCFDREDSRRVIEEHFSHRLAWHERNRRIFGHAFAKVLEGTDNRNISRDSKNKVERFGRSSSEYDDVFLRRKEAMASRLLDQKNPSAVPKKSALVARSISDHHWIEEWVKVTDELISFYPPDRNKARFALSLSSIIHVEPLPPDQSPCFPNYSFLAIATVGRRTYLMFASELERDEWVDLLMNKIRSSSSSSTHKDPLMSVDDPSEEFLHKSSMWDCRQRRILNCRYFCFLQTQQPNVDSLKLGEDALRKAFACDVGTNVSVLGEFLDATARLKHVDANQLHDHERLAFFLNLYHTLLMHAFLVLGPPDSGFKWISFFNSISYQCSDDIFSLAELEHCIIRAAMSYPSQFISRFVLPKSKYTFEISKPDYRINFALNCGSVSNPSAVPIFKADGLDQQLESASRLFVDELVKIKQRSSAQEIIIHLPRVCQWFSEDFGNGSNEDILRRIEPYLSEDKRRLLATCWSDREKRYNFGELTIKYLPYSFECRYLGLTDEVG